MRYKDPFTEYQFLMLLQWHNSKTHVKFANLARFCKTAWNWGLTELVKLNVDKDFIKNSENLFDEYSMKLIENVLTQSIFVLCSRGNKKKKKKISDISVSKGKIVFLKFS